MSTFIYLEFYLFIPSIYLYISLSIW